MSQLSILKHREKEPCCAAYFIILNLFTRGRLPFLFRVLMLPSSGLLTTSSSDSELDSKYRSSSFSTFGGRGDMVGKAE